MFKFACIPSEDNDADIGTKVMPLPVFHKLRDRGTGRRADAQIMAVLNAVQAKYELTLSSPRPDARRGAEHGGVLDPG